MVKPTLKTLQCKHSNISKVCMTIFNIMHEEVIIHYNLTTTQKKKIKIKNEKPQKKDIRTILTFILHCVKSVCIWSYSGPYFPAFRLKLHFHTTSYPVNKFLMKKSHVESTLYKK